MSKAKDTFAQSIKDAENLLQHFNDLNKKPPPAPELEVLKRAGLVMAMTAWETYVEDRVLEACTERLRDLSDGRLPSLSNRNSLRRSRDCIILLRRRPCSYSASTLESTLQIIGSGMGVILALSRKGWMIT